ncbi:hypothetical protein FKM82_018636 [Ascaphus truei]
MIPISTALRSRLFASTVEFTCCLSLLWTSFNKTVITDCLSLSTVVSDDVFSVFLTLTTGFPSWIRVTLLELSTCPSLTFVDLETMVLLFLCLLDPVSVLPLALSFLCGGLESGISHKELSLEDLKKNVSPEI